MLGQLPPPLELKGNSVAEVIENIYGHFYDIFLRKEIKPLYKGKFIFFDMSKSYRNVELSWPERFMHICSIEDKRYEMFPCNNDISINSCENSCDQTKASIQFQCLQRIECLYRLSRLNWIPEVINMANNENKHVMCWSEEFKDRNGNRVIKHYLRYKNGMHDFLIILGERKMRGNVCYSFITAFPIFLKRESSQLMQSYLNYQKK